MSLYRVVLGALAVFAIAGGAPSTSAQTVTYSYDAMGRLKTSSVSGGPSNGTNTAICYDAANNRVRYVTNTGGSASCTSSAMRTPAPRRGGRGVRMNAR